MSSHNLGRFARETLPHGRPGPSKNESALTNLEPAKPPLCIVPLLGVPSHVLWSAGLCRATAWIPGRIIAARPGGSLPRIPSWRPQSSSDGFRLLRNIPPNCRPNHFVAVVCLASRHKEHKGLRNAFSTPRATNRERSELAFLVMQGFSL